jgi:iron(III) transport system ATP-binding protein
MASTSIRLEGVGKRFGDVVAVDRADLEVRGGELVALLGPSGCGKTTLLRTIAGFERPDAGSVELDGRAVAGGRAWVPPESRRVGMVFQDYALFPHLTASRNVGFGLPRRERAQRVPAVLELVELHGLGERYPHELSGGQQQRVALARALAPSPAIVLLDEPWSNVDPQLRAELRQDVSAILTHLGVTALLVTHDREEAFALADRIALMRAGRIVQVDTPERLYRAPADRWSAEFVGPANVLDGRVVDASVHTVLGSFPANGASGRGRVGVLVRPELLELAPDPAGAAQVVSREFRGHDVVYRLRVDDVELVSQRPSTESVDVGTRVRITLHDGDVVVLN